MVDEVHKQLTSKIREAKPELTLAFFYTMDSIMKNIGDPYKSKFQTTLIPDFKIVFTKLDIESRRALYKLRTTW